MEKEREEKKERNGKMNEKIKEKRNLMAVKMQIFPAQLKKTFFELFNDWLSKTIASIFY